jgi:RNA polymerase sigma factor (sigma-70 family)
MDIGLKFNFDESVLVEACVNQERWAQQHLYEAHYSQMMAVCLRYASSKEEALDILHDGFLKVFRYIHKYTPVNSLGAWIRTIMVNTCIDHFRKQKKRHTESLEDTHFIYDDQPNPISQMSEQDVLKAVQSLPPTYRAVFNMYVIEGYSHKEIGELLEINESTSRSNLVKARGKLQDIIRSLNL